MHCGVFLLRSYLYSILETEGFQTFLQGTRGRAAGNMVLKHRAGEIFDQSIIVRDNAQIIIEKEEKTPPPYSSSTRGSSKNRRLDEVTYNNNLELNYYDNRPKLKPDMDYIYSHIPRKEYEKFWESYRKQYQNMETKYKEIS